MRKTYEKWPKMMKDLWRNEKDVWKNEKDMRWNEMKKEKGAKKRNEKTP